MRVRQVRVRFLLCIFLVDLYLLDHRNNIDHLASYLASGVNNVGSN
jgi:hypothetical protein